jgi:hypothetical protein
LQQSWLEISPHQPTGMMHRLAAELQQLLAASYSTGSKLDRSIE